MTKLRTERQDIYLEMLRSPKWQKKRLEILQKHDFKCDECGERDRELQVHHCWYEKGKMPWDYPDECFKVQCDTHHKMWHEEKHLLDVSVAKLSLRHMMNLMEMVERDNFVSDMSTILWENPCDIDLIKVGLVLVKDYKSAVAYAIKRQKEEDKKHGN